MNTATIRLQYIGFVNAKPAESIKVGDTLVWNSGFTSKVEAVRGVSKAFMLVSERSSYDGKLYDRRMKKTRLVGVTRDSL